MVKKRNRKRLELKIVDRNNNFISNYNNNAYDYDYNSDSDSNKIVLSEGQSPSPLLSMKKRSDTIDFTTVCAQQKVSELLSSVCNNSNDYILAEESIDCIPFLCKGTKILLGYVNVSDSILTKLIKTLRRYKSHNSICIKSLDIIISLISNKESNILRFANISTIKIITLVLFEYVVKNPKAIEKQSICLQNIIKKFQKMNMNIDGNIRSTIFSYLYYQKSNEKIIIKSLQILLQFINFNSIRVNPKLLISDGSGEVVIKILESTKNISLLLISLEFLEKNISLLFSHLNEQGRNRKNLKKLIVIDGIIESLGFMIKNNIQEINVIGCAINVLQLILGTLYAINNDTDIDNKFIFSDNEILNICVMKINNIDFINIFFSTLLFHIENKEILLSGLDIINTIYECQYLNTEIINTLFLAENIITPLYNHVFELHNKAIELYCDDKRIILKLDGILNHGI